MPNNGSRTVQITIPPNASGPLWPARCVCCGAPKEAESNLAISRNVMLGKGKRRKQVTKSVKWPIPHCRRCASSTKSVFLAALLPYALGFVLCGLLGFVAGVAVAAYFRIDENTSPNTFASWTIGVAAGLGAGLVGGLVFELLARIVLLPFYGRALLSAPVLGTQVFSDSDYVAGLHANMSADGTQMQLRFANAGIAGEFEALNAAAIVP